jgi:hypothetical protein
LRRPRRDGIGGLSWWFVLAVASLLLVFSAGLSLLYSPSTTTGPPTLYAARLQIHAGLVYSTETVGQSYGGLPGCATGGTPPVDYRGYMFQVRLVPALIEGLEC